MSGLSRRNFLSTAVSLIAVPVLSDAATAQDLYPSRPIHLIVGFTPGTAADITARAFGNGAEGVLGQKIIVEDKPGAGSNVAAEYVARATKDGYTLFLSSLSIVTSQVMNPDTIFDLTKDFAPVSLLASGAVVLVVSPQSNLHSVAELIALARSKPAEVLCATAGVGSLPHMAAEAGMPDFDTSLWFGLMAPAGTPQTAIAKVAKSAEAAMRAPQTVETLKKQGFDPIGEGPDRFGPYLRSEIARWSEVAARVKG
jgi:tripartite-type tricarboxylate transporter receptor subunit TctC